MSRVKILTLDYIHQIRWQACLLKRHDGFHICGSNNTNFVFSTPFICFFWGSCLNRGTLGVEILYNLDNIVDLISDTVKGTFMNKFKTLPSNTFNTTRVTLQGVMIIWQVKDKTKNDLGHFGFNLHLLKSIFDLFTLNRSPNIFCIVFVVHQKITNWTQQSTAP